MRNANRKNSPAPTLAHSRFSFLMMFVLLGLSFQAFAADQNTAPSVPANSPPAETSKTPDGQEHLPVGDRLLADFGKTYGVTLGFKADAPFWVVALTPSCKDCKEFWNMIRDRVKKGDLRIRLYPAALKDSDDERAAARLLQSADPFSAWNKHMDGDRAALAGSADQKSLEHVRATTDVVKRWHLPTAPYIIYRAHSGQVKIVQGVPVKIEDVVDDAAPEKPEAKL